MRCVNVSSGHSKGHQTSDGKIFATGDFVTSISRAELQRDFESRVFVCLQKLHQDLQDRTVKGENDMAVAKEIHQEQTLRPFWGGLNDDGVVRHFHSHTACFCCLFDVPEHALPCGHTICTKCASMYGEYDGPQMSLRIQSCPLCTGGPKQNHPWTIHLKPKTAGVRILTLDGYAPFIFKLH